MPTKKRQPLDTDSLLSDINYVNQANKNEIKRTNDQFRLRIAEVGLTGNAVDSIIKEVSTQLGQLSVKVNLAEQAIRSIRLEQKLKTTVPTAKHDINSNGEDLEFGVGLLVGNKNLLPIETNRAGINYVWSSANPETQFTFPLDRHKKLCMQIRLVSLIKPEFPEQLKIFIDEVHIKHSLSMDGDLFLVSCNLPSSSKTNETDIKIVLPATHSPMSLGGSGDGRKLGIAINEIRFVKFENRFTQLLKRLKLMS
ncbi:MAG: hypothetical protein DRR42_28215 [Gammaproteobacteria bacterium]|nr:MAG: hypothetical protein DRR42_28215 [Gammaproteobacteria bacterium]